MLLDYILVKENSLDLIIVGEYDNNFDFIIDDIKRYPDRISRIWRLDKKSLKYIDDTFRITISRNYSQIKILLNGSDFNLTNFKNLKKGRYEYHKYKMYLDGGNIFVHKKNILRRR